MLSAVVSIGTVAALSAGLAAPARTLADAEISILKALAILFVARVMSRTLRTLIPDTKSLSQKGRMGSRLKDRAWNRGAKDGTHQGGGGVAHGVGGAR